MSLERLEEHRRLWEGKPELRAVYEVWFELLLDGIPEKARVLEVGSGPGLLAEAARRLRPDLRWTSSDLLVTPWNDLAADASRLPLATGGVDAVVGVDVLHHLPRPAHFFREAARVLGGVGELRLVEPWITPLGWIVYRFFHQEDCRLRLDPWDPFPGPEKDAFDGNAAVPWRLVGRTAAWEWRHLGLEPPRRRRLNAFAYLLSLGFREASLPSTGTGAPPPRPRSVDGAALPAPRPARAARLGERGCGAGDVRPAGTPGRRAPGRGRPEGFGPGGAGPSGPRLPTSATRQVAGGVRGSARPRGPGRDPDPSPLVAEVIARAGASSGCSPNRRQDLEPAELYEEVEVRRVSFAAKEEAGGWRDADGAPLDVSEGTVRLAGEQAVAGSSVRSGKRPRPST